jgi:hypothetical protein
MFFLEICQVSKSLLKPLRSYTCRKSYTPPAARMRVKSPLKKRQPEVRQDILAACLGRISTWKSKEFPDIQAPRPDRYSGRKICEKTGMCDVSEVHLQSAPDECFLTAALLCGILSLWHFLCIWFLANKPHTCATEEEKYVQPAAILWFRPTLCAKPKPEM